MYRINNDYISEEDVDLTQIDVEPKRRYDLESKPLYTYCYEINGYIYYQSNISGQLSPYYYSEDY